MTKPNRPDVALLERLNSERTQGEWMWMGSNWKFLNAEPDTEVLCESIQHGISVLEVDAAFIAAAANEMTGLLEYVRKLEWVVEAADAAQKRYMAASDWYDTDLDAALEGLGCD